MSYKYQILLINIQPPSSPDNRKLVIDENFSPRKSPSQSSISVSPNPEESLASFLPWPLLLQQLSMQKTTQCPQNLLQNLNELFLHLTTDC